MAILSAVFFCIAAGDYLLGNRLGLAESFKQGFESVVELILIMTGFMALTPCMVPFFSGFALLLRGISLFGFCVAVFQEASGIIFLEGLMSLDEIFPIISRIGVFLGGILPFFTLVQRLLNNPLNALCKKLNLQKKAVFFRDCNPHDDWQNNFSFFGIGGLLFLLLGPFRS